MNYESFLFVIQERLSADQKAELWEKVLKKSFAVIRKKLEYEKNKKIRKRLVKNAYEDASDEYHKELERRED